MFLYVYAFLFSCAVIAPKKNGYSFSLYPLVLPDQAVRTGRAALNLWSTPMSVSTSPQVL